MSDSRQVNARYRDPLDAIWLGAARQLGLRVVRSEEVFASFDGASTLYIAERAHLDADDSLAQMIFHELCHALIAGPRGSGQPDWALSNHDDRDLLQEHACQRLQAALAARHRLRDFLAVTTHHRPYWDELPADPLADRDNPAVRLALEGWDRARHGPWADTLQRALAATAELADVVRGWVDDDSLWRTVPPRHASGFVQNADPGLSCGSCAWMYHAGPGRPVTRCRQTRKGTGSVATRVEPSARACVRWEPRFDDSECGRCGACCGEGFDVVQIRRGERASRLALAVVDTRFGAHMPRPGGRCVALKGDGQRAPYRCQVYADRPRACAEFEVAGDACMQARRRVGLPA